jgi:TPR repeat protein
MKTFLLILTLSSFTFSAFADDPLKADLDVDGVVVKAIPSKPKGNENCPCVKKWFNKARKEDLVAMYSLANCYGIAPDSKNKIIVSDKYCEMNMEMYVDWMGAAATRGFAPAQYAYGTAWFYGSGSKPKSSDKGIKWWAQAASQGVAPAYYSLGDIYEHGLGRKVDLTKALALFKEAERLGDNRAKERIQSLESPTKKK